ncbi:uncharacterized protein LOC122498497 [Leptopilina heterotoma]|uniref:uncharacterized protein LOC122498497 n=1 Tax=Leptopilina heterotoma TaxID=63436 RepID=UPI001CA8A2EA|nr:uncharacterized protein LOC122498497 [Leptopilina heterotoma]
MRFLISLFICFIFYAFCESRTTDLHRSEERAAMVCTREDPELPGWFICTKHDCSIFSNRIEDGKIFCVDEIRIDDVPHYFCATKIPFFDGPCTAAVQRMTRYGSLDSVD